MFELIADDRSERDVDKLARFFDTFGYRIVGREREDIEDAVHAGFARNFLLQRSPQGPWKKLAQQTMDQRLLKGFRPARPILYRTGDFRDTFVERGHPDHFSQPWNSSREFVLEEGSDSPLSSVLQGGSVKKNIPPRPVADLDQQAKDHLGDTIHDMINRLMRREGL